MNGKLKSNKLAAEYDQRKCNLHFGCAYLDTGTYSNEYWKLPAKIQYAEVWPILELYIHGGVSFTPYREQFQKLMVEKSITWKCIMPVKDFLRPRIIPDEDGMLLFTRPWYFYGVHAGGRIW